MRKILTVFVVLLMLVSNTMLQPVLTYASTNFSNAEDIDVQQIENISSEQITDVSEDLNQEIEIVEDIDLPIDEATENNALNENETNVDEEDRTTSLAAPEENQSPAQLPTTALENDEEILNTNSSTEIQSSTAPSENSIEIDDEELVDVQSEEIPTEKEQQVNESVSDLHSKSAQ